MVVNSRFSTLHSKSVIVRFTMLYIFIYLFVTFYDVKSLLFIMFNFYFLFTNMVVAIPTTCFCGESAKDDADHLDHLLKLHPRKPTFYRPLKYIYVLMIDLHSLAR